MISRTQENLKELELNIAWDVASMIAIVWGLNSSTISLEKCSFAPNPSLDVVEDFTRLILIKESTLIIGDCSIVDFLNYKELDSPSWENTCGWFSGLVIVGKSHTAIISSSIGNASFGEIYTKGGYLKLEDVSLKTRETETMSSKWKSVWLI